MDWDTVLVVAFVLTTLVLGLLAVVGGVTIARQLIGG